MEFADSKPGRTRQGRCCGRSPITGCSKNTGFAGGFGFGKVCSQATAQFVQIIQRSGSILQAGFFAAVHGGIAFDADDIEAVFVGRTDKIFPQEYKQAVSLFAQIQFGRGAVMLWSIERVGDIAFGWQADLCQQVFGDFFSSSTGKNQCVFRLGRVGTFRIGSFFLQSSREMGKLAEKGKSG